MASTPESGSTSCTCPSSLTNTANVDAGGFRLVERVHGPSHADVADARGYTHSRNQTDPLGSRGLVVRQPGVRARAHQVHEVDTAPHGRGESLQALSVGERAEDHVAAPERGIASVLFRDIQLEERQSLARHGTRGTLQLRRASVRERDRVLPVALYEILGQGSPHHAGAEHEEVAHLSLLEDPENRIQRSRQRSHGEGVRQLCLHVVHVIAGATQGRQHGRIRER